MADSLTYPIDLEAERAAPPARQRPGFIGRLWRALGNLIVAAALAGLVAVLLPSVVLFAEHGRLALDYPYTLNYGEGPLLDQTARLVRGGDLYRGDLASPPYTITNYPPVYLMAQGIFFAQEGPAFWYGRLISLVSTGAAALLLALIVNAITRDGVAALAALLLLPAMPYILHWSALARIDSLALALSLAGLYAAIRSPESRVTLVLAVVLLALAVYTRQTYALAAPLAAFGWLWGTRRRIRALLLAVLLADLVLVVFALLLVLTRGGFFFHVITANVNALDGRLIETYLEEMRLHLPIFLGMTALVLVAGLVGVLIRQFGRGDALNAQRTPFEPLPAAREMPTRAWWLVAPYTLGAVVSALTISKVGSDVNYLYELCAAFALAAGVLVAWLRPLPVVRVAAMGLLALQVTWAYHLAESKYVPIVRERVTERAEVEALMTSVAAIDAPVLADEHMGLLVLQGRPILFQPFEMSQLALAGVWDEAPFLAALERGDYPAILLYQPYRNPSLRFERWTPDMLRILNSAFRPDLQRAETTLYRYAE